MPGDPAVLDRLLTELDHLPARGTTAIEVLWLVDDPRVSSDQLAKVVSNDEALTTRIMRMANAPFYGLSGRVSSATFAITVLGFDTVRAVAAASAAGVMHDSVPEWMLHESSMTAVAANMIAPRLGRPASEATSLGLLHNLGSMLLHRSDVRAHSALVADARRDGVPVHELEEQHFGAPGHELAAALLGRWAFPTEFVEALMSQRDQATAATSPLGRLLIASIAVMSELLHPTTDAAEQQRRHEALAHSHADDSLVERVRTEAEDLHSASFRG